MNVLRSGAASAVALLMLTVAPGPLLSVAAAQQATKVASGHALAIQVNQGQLVRIDKPVESVFVANSEIADVAIKSPQLIYVFAKRPGTTTLYAVGANDEILASITLNVTHNLSRLEQAIAELMPGRNITATSIDGGIVLTGAVLSATEAEDARRVAARFLGEKEEVINRLQVTAPNQVNLRLRFAEVNKSVMRNLGINWDVAIQQGGFAFGLLTAFPLTLSNVAAGTTAGTVNGARGVAGPTVSTGPLDLTATMDLLAQEGLVSVLAEPNLTAVSGETANFLAGGEFPVPVAQDNNTNTIEFKPFGVSLGFVPTVLSGNRISLRVAPEVSALDQANAVNGVPALTVRRATTTVELASGQTFAIAGLVQSSNSITANEVPGLGDIPILGELFKSDKFQHNETELVILATPYIVQPISNPAAPAIPNEPMLGADGSQRLAGSSSAATGSSGMTGQAGFVIE